jgi:hypothetical protein
MFELRGELLQLSNLHFLLERHHLFGPRHV